MKSLYDDLLLNTNERKEIPILIEPNIEETENIENNMNDPVFSFTKNSISFRDENKNEFL